MELTIFFVAAFAKQHTFPPIDDDLQLRTNGHEFSTGGIFATFPADHITTISAATRDQIIATAALLFGVQVICDEKNLAVPKKLQPLYLALLITVLSGAFGELFASHSTAYRIS